MQKYRLIREGAEAAVPQLEFCEAQAASDGVLALAHHPDYIQAVRDGMLSAEQQLSIGFPWSLDMVERSRRSAGATVITNHTALKEGIAIKHAGGTHHAF